DDVRVADVAAAAGANGQRVLALDARAHDVDEAGARHRRRAGRGGADATAFPELGAGLRVEAEHEIRGVQYELRFPARNIHDQRRRPAVGNAAGPPHFLACVLVERHQGVVLDGGIDDDQILVEHWTRGGTPAVEPGADL